MVPCPCSIGGAIVWCWSAVVALLVCICINNIFISEHGVGRFMAKVFCMKNKEEKWCGHHRKGYIISKTTPSPHLLSLFGKGKFLYTLLTSKAYITLHCIGRYMYIARIIMWELAYPLDNGKQTINKCNRYLFLYVLTYLALLFYNQQQWS